MPQGLPCALPGRPCAMSGDEKPDPDAVVPCFHCLFPMSGPPLRDVRTPVTRGTGACAQCKSSPASCRTSQPPWTAAACCRFPGASLLARGDGWRKDDEGLFFRSSSAPAAGCGEESGSRLHAVQVAFPVPACWPGVDGWRKGDEGLFFRSSSASRSRLRGGKRQQAARSPRGAWVMLMFI
jgi:hypothetical protein